MIRLILLVGLPGTGKTTVAEILRREYSCTVLNVGEVLRRTLGDTARDLPRDRIGPAYLEHNSIGDIATAIGRELQRVHGDAACVVDGIRYSETCLQLKQMHSMAEIWKLRLGDPMRRDRVNRRSGASREAHVSPLMARWLNEDALLERIADCIIDNDKTVDSLRAAVERTWTRNRSPRFSK